MNRHQRRASSVQAGSPEGAALFAAAREAFQAGRAAEAEAALESLLAQAPDHADGWNLRGVAAIQGGRRGQALEYFRRAADLAPAASYLGNLGSCLYECGRAGEALPWLERAAALAPGNAGFQNSLGNALAALGRTLEAEAAYERAVALRGDFFQARVNLADILRKDGRLEAAETHLAAALAARPDLAEARIGLGLVRRDQGRLPEALEQFRAILAGRPDYLLAWKNIGLVHSQTGDFRLAAACFVQCRTLAPDDADADALAAHCLREIGEWAMAETCYRAALARQPGQPDLCIDLAYVLTSAGKGAEAVALLDGLALPDDPRRLFFLGAAWASLGETAHAAACYRAVLDIDPDYPAALNNLGNALRELGDVSESERLLRRAVALEPDNADLHQNLGMTLLAQGALAEGWAEYEWRLKTRAMAGEWPDDPAPRWQGEAAPGKTLLVRAEQGFGDSLQFCRFAPLAAERGLSVLLQVPAPLVRLLGSLEGAAGVLGPEETPPAVDYVCPMLSLPYTLARPLPPAPAAYLSPAPALAARWRRRVEAAAPEGPRIGLAWAGNPRPHLPAARLIDARRSMPFERMAPLLDLPGARFFSLQKDMAPPTPRLISLMDGVTDFADTAALAAGLDLVITVDTALAHLAGAIGRPVWLLDRFDHCWRWPQSAGGDGWLSTPWYPRLRLYRQPRWGDWPAVIERVRADLAAFLAEAAAV
ncbi:cellulose synthase operon protein C precursor [mine drainage metagenome]|uniref:Cellulose synthase operon protein C n=1 Tax=mine drainage metagenome TaxID=410659 RepID=A0A1J5S1T3_9ZZZZ